MTTDTTTDAETDRQEDTDVEVAAYLFESTTEEYNDSWGLHVKFYHPDEIVNSEYRELQRLARVDELPGDPDPVASLYTLGDSAESGNEHVDVNLFDESSHEDVHNVRYLAPIPEDRDKNPSSPPYEPQDKAVYFKHVEEDETYYKVWMTENQAMCIYRDKNGEVIRNRDVIIYDVWDMEDCGLVNRIRYEKTLFAEPAYEHIGR